jgi:hypothetical protein
VGVGERPRTVPAGLVNLPPGPVLAVLLESVDHSAVDADEMEFVLRARARARQIWHLQAELMVDLYMAAQAVRQRIGAAPPAVRRRQASEYVGWRLGWSARWAQAQIDLADALLTRFPDVFAAMAEGRLDPARAQAFVDLLSDVDDEATVRWILDRLLPKAPRWTLAELRERLRYHVQRRAPQAAKQRWQRRVAERDVRLRPEPDGTASLTGVGLPAPRAVAAFDRIDRLARAARAAGDPRTLAQLRGDAFTDLLAGVPFQTTPSIDPLTAEADARYPQPDRDTHLPGPAGGGRGVDGDRASGDASAEEPASSGGGGDAEDQAVPADTTDLIDEYDYERWFGHTDADQRWVDQHWTDPDQSNPDRPDHGQTGHVDSRFETGNRAAALAALRRAAAGGSRLATGNQVRGVAFGAGVAAGRGPASRVSGRELVATSNAVSSAQLAGAESASNSWFETGNRDGPVLAGDRCGRCGGRLVPPRPGAVQVSVKLTTLLGHDDHPGLLAGYGPIPADAARQIATDPVLNPVWRWSVFDSHGDLLHHGTTTRRPTRPAQPAVSTPPGPAGSAEHSTPAERSTQGASEVRPRPGSDSVSATGTPDQSCTCPRVEVSQRRSVVEIQLTPADLTAEHDAGRAHGTGWAAVLADIAAQVDADARANPPGKWSEVDDQGRLRHHGHTGRHPTAAEAAFIRARDRTCRAPHCRRPAAACDIDHAREHHRGGPSHRGNCRCLCRRHHTLRHTAGVTVVDRSTDHGRVTLWTLPDGRTYQVTREKDIILTIDDDQSTTR